jgi:hypothetical protein
MMGKYLVGFPPRFLWKKILTNMILIIKLIRECCISYCIRFHFVIFIKVMEICTWYFGALDQLGVIHLHGIGLFNGGLLACTFLVDHFLVAY